MFGTGTAGSFIFCVALFFIDSASVSLAVEKAANLHAVLKNGVGSIVVMSMESYEQNRYDSMVYDKLREAELQAASTTERLSHADVMAKARAFLSGAEEQKRA